LFTSAQITQMMANNQQAAFMTNMQSQALTQRMVGGNIFSNDPTEAAAGTLGLVGGAGHAVGGALGMAGSLPGFMVAAGLASKTGTRMLGTSLLGRGVGMAARGIVGFGGVPFMAGTFALEKAASSFMEGARGYVDTSRFVNQWSRQAGNVGGRGFSQSDKDQIYQTIKGLSQVKEIGGDITKALDFVKTYRDAGLMEGVRNAKQFSKRFGELMKSTNDIVKTLGASLQNAQQMVIELDKVGITAGGVKAAASSLRRQADATGMSVDQIHAFRAQGGEMAWQAGGSRATGYMATGRSLEMMNAMVKGGLISQDLLKAGFGVGGAEGIQSGAALLQQAGLGLASTGFGKQLISNEVYAKALGNVRGGRYTGTLDQKLLEQVRSGRISFTDLKRIGAEKYKGLGFGGQQSFELTRGAITGEMGTELGALGWGGMAQREFINRFGAGGTYKGKNLGEAMTAFMMRTTGADSRQAAMLAHMLAAAPAASREVEKSQYASLMEEARQNVSKRKYGSGSIWEDMKDDLKKSWREAWAPFRELGSRFAQNVEEGKRDRRHVYRRDANIIRHTGERIRERMKTGRYVPGVSEDPNAVVGLTDEMTVFNYARSGGGRYEYVPGFGEDPGTFEDFADPRVRARYAEWSRGQKGGVYKLGSGSKYQSTAKRREVEKWKQEAAEYREGKRGTNLGKGDIEAFLARVEDVTPALEGATGGAGFLKLSESLGKEMSPQKLLEYYSAMEREYGKQYDDLLKQKSDAEDKMRTGKTDKERKAAAAQVKEIETKISKLPVSPDAIKTVRETAGKVVGGAAASDVTAGEMVERMRSAEDARKQFISTTGDTDWLWMNSKANTLKGVSSGAIGEVGRVGGDTALQIGKLVKEGKRLEATKVGLAAGVDRKYIKDVLGIAAQVYEETDQGNDKKQLDKILALAKKAQKATESAGEAEIIVSSQKYLDKLKEAMAPTEEEKKAGKGGKITKDEWTGMKADKFSGQLIEDLASSDKALYDKVDKILSKGGSLDQQTMDQLVSELQDLAVRYGTEDVATGPSETDADVDVIKEAADAARDAAESNVRLRKAADSAADALYNFPTIVDTIKEKVDELKK
jgi:hypothetical protein